MVSSTLRKLIFNLRCSLRGLFLSYAEHSFMLEILLGVVFFVPVFFFKDIYFDRLSSILVAYVVLLASELLNTSIEKICDRITREYDEEIRNIKDVSSAAVFLVLALNIFLMVIYLAKVIA